MRIDFGQAYCKKCDQKYDFSQLAFWTDSAFKCPQCFSSTVIMEYPRGPLVVNNYFNYKNDAPLLLLIIDGLYIAGVQRHCLYLIQTFKDLGIDVLLIAVEGGGIWAERFFSLASLSIIAAPNIALNWNDIIKISPQILDRHIVAASSHLLLPSLWAIDNLPDTIKIIANLHSEPSEHEIFTNESFYKIAVKSSKLIFPAETTLNAFVNVSVDFLQNRNKLIVLPNHIYKTKYDNKVSKCNNTNVLNIAVISRIDNDKFSIDLFIETILRLKESICFYIKVAGDGELLDILKEKTKSLNLDGLISFEGFVENIECIYEWADIIFLPSKRESMPYVLLESLNYGVPLVLPNYGFVSSIAQHEFLNSKSSLIYTFQTNNPEDASKNIILASKTLFFTDKNVLGNLESDYDWIERIKNIYLLLEDKKNV